MQSRLFRAIYGLLVSGLGAFSMAVPGLGTLVAHKPTAIMVVRTIVNSVRNDQVERRCRSW